MSDVCQQIRQTSARRLVRSLLFRPRKLWEIAQGLSEEAQCIQRAISNRASRLLRSSLSARHSLCAAHSLRHANFCRQAAGRSSTRRQRPDPDPLTETESAAIDSYHRPGPASPPGRAGPRLSGGAPDAAAHGRLRPGTGRRQNDAAGAAATGSSPGDGWAEMVSAWKWPRPFRRRRRLPVCRRAAGRSCRRRLGERGGDGILAGGRARWP